MSHSVPFTLNCLKVEDNSPLQVIYDPYAGTLKYVDGTDVTPLKEIVKNIENSNIDYLCDGNFKSTDVEDNSFSPENPKNKTRTVGTLKIQLGLKCNYSCGYCSQATHLSKGEAFDTNISDARSFLDNLDKWIVGEPRQIEFWGGEPLLYIKKLYVLIPELRFRFPNTKFGIITNGALLNDNITAFLIENDFSISVSHDGPGQPLRGPDPLNDVEVLRNIRNTIKTHTGKFCFNVVLTRNNHDPLVIRKWFEEKIGLDDIPVNFEGVVNAHDNEHQQDALFRDSDLLSIQERILNVMFNGEQKDIISFWPRISDFSRSLATNRKASVLGQKCGMDKEDNIAVDLLGNVMTCQNVGPNSKHLLGSVYDMENVKLDTSWHWSTRESCMHCPVVQICKGSCMYLEGDEFAETCNNEYNYAMPILATVFYEYYGLKVMNIGGDIRRPKVKKKINIPVVSA